VVAVAVAEEEQEQEQVKSCQNHKRVIWMAKMVLTQKEKWTASLFSADRSVSEPHRDPRSWSA
jgi:hypothetical protein